MFVAGLVLFTIASLLCGLSTTPLMLNLARGLQGIGGALMFATSLALLASAYVGMDRGTAIGIWGATIGAAVAVGPLVGGALVEGFGWEAIFYVNLPIGIAAIALTLTRVQESRDPHGGGLDWFGTVTFSGALFLLVFGLIRGNAENWNAQVISCLIGAALLLARLRDDRATHRVPDARSLAVPQAVVLRRLDRCVRAVGVDVRDVPLHHAVGAEHPRLLGAGVRPALPAADADLVRDRARFGQARRAIRRALVPGRRARAASASACC